jgi:hypothetical protein
MFLSKRLDRDPPACATWSGSSRREQIEKSLPATKGLIDLLNRARPIIARAHSLYVEAEPRIEEAERQWQTVGPCGADFDRCDFA